MKCRQIRSDIGQCFDEARTLPLEAVEHLRDCSPCRAYHEELKVLEKGFGCIALEQPATDLAQRIKANMATAVVQTPRESVMPVLWGFILVLVVGVILVGYWYPISMTPESWGSISELSIPRITLFEELDAPYEACLQTWRLLTDFMGQHTWSIPNVTLWLILVGVFVFLLGFNSFEAKRLRVVSHDSSFSRKRH
jgi:hypothetical protein